MRADYLKSACRHLKILGLSPVVQSQPYKSLIFSLSDSIEAELIPLESNTNAMFFTLVTVIDIPPHDQLDIFALALSPRLMPAAIKSIKGQLALEVRLQCSQKSINGILDEGVVLMRHLIGPVFTAAMKLAQGEAELISLLDTAINQLQSQREIN